MLNTLEKHQKIYYQDSRPQIPYLSRQISLLNIKSTLYILLSFDITDYNTKFNRRARIKTLSSTQPYLLLIALLYYRLSILLTLYSQDPLYYSYTSQYIPRRISLYYYIRIIVFLMFLAIEQVLLLTYLKIQIKRTLKDKLF